MIIVFTFQHNVELFEIIFYDPELHFLKVLFICYGINFKFNFYVEYPSISWCVVPLCNVSPE